VLLNTLNQPDDELEERQNDISKARHRLSKKIDALGDGIESELKDIVRRGRNQLEDSVESACKRMDGIIDGWGKFSSYKSIIPQLERECQTLVTRILKRDVESISEIAKGKIENAVTDFFSDAGIILSRYVKDFDTEDFLEKAKIEMDIEDQSVFEYTTEKEEDESNLGKFVYNFLNGFTFGVVGVVDSVLDALSHSDVKNEFHKHVNEIRNTDVTEFLNTVFQRKDEIIAKVKSGFINDLIEPLEKEINDIVANRDQREKKLHEVQEKLNGLKAEKSKIEKQIEEIKQIQEV
jgi:hypothetical protein